MSPWRASSLMGQSKKFAISIKISSKHVKIANIVIVVLIVAQERKKILVEIFSPNLLNVFMIPIAGNGRIIKRRWSMEFTKVTPREEDCGSLAPCDPEVGNCGPATGGSCDPCSP